MSIMATTVKDGMVFVKRSTLSDESQEAASFCGAPLDEWLQIDFFIQYYGLHGNKDKESLFLRNKEKTLNAFAKLNGENKK